VKQRYVWVGMGISLALVIYLFFFFPVHYGRLWASLASANAVLLLLAAGLLAGTLAIRSWRWQYLLKPLKEVEFSSLMSATSIGMMANMIFPLRLGEIVRAVVLGHREHMDKSASLATVVIDRLLDGFTILFILAVLLLVSSLPLEGGLARAVWWGGLAMLALYLGVFVFLFYLYHATAQALQAVRRIDMVLPLRWVDKLSQFLESFSAGLQPLGRKEYLGQIIVTSIMLWGTYGLFNFLVVLAFQLQLPLTVGFLLVVFQAFAVMVPSSPGFVGTYHAASVACLTLWGVSPEVALSVALVMHAIGFFLTIGIGASYLWGIGVSLHDITRPGMDISSSPPA
jgi:glycosyltransferase 2 family protein